jgi:hypothetical protein
MTCDASALTAEACAKTYDASALRTDACASSIFEGVDNPTSLHPRGIYPILVTGFTLLSVHKKLGCPHKQKLGDPFFGKGYYSYITVVVSLRDFVDEMQTLSDEKGIAYDD